ncbi:hypothetical protein GCM10022243_52410 [Saccharothrix violaceirubra]|uniref:Transcriptional regulator with XRE-family HTH domain n=1 Tax=Saccharothrix violaceirubra TaxID=413306 RepID=A0A7W7TAC4_9PSEU|nr:helix-turn-helix transcriptional regulator [Saccharothrix violaceirubra]MBB4969458.1 transcriptional regulator with XRE-family HTH domain [Saccharothrix violaceirubra]
MGKRQGLTRARKAAGFTQESFAEAMGVDRSAVVRWEAGSRSPHPHQRSRLSTLLGITMGELDQLLDVPLPAMPVVPAPMPEATVAADQERWREQRSVLIRDRTALAWRARALYDQAWHLPDAPVLALPGWIPVEPIPLTEVVLDWRDAPPPMITGTAAELRPVLPLRSPGRAFTRYSTAVRYLAPPRLFENRPSYRLLDVEPGARRLTFGAMTFFDKYDVSEALTHELAVAPVGEGWSALPFRSRLARPFDLDTRPVGTSIATLTIRRGDPPTFLMLHRDPARVASGGGQYGVVPAGEFQPAGIASESLRADLDLWRNTVREYSEELLGEPEHDGTTGRPLDYEVWPFHRDLTAARDSGGLSAQVLGVVLSAPGLNAAICTAVVFEPEVFDRLFRDRVADNAEGRVVEALAFDEPTVRRFLDREPLGATNAACLALAWAHRERLVG